MLADGTVHTLDRTHEPELFQAVLGGYGLFGVVLEAELDLVDSEMYELTQRTVAYDRFPDLFRDELWPDDRYRLMYAHLSTSPDSLLREAVVYTYETTAAGEPVPPLREPESMAFGRFVLNLARTGEVGQRVKWAAQRHLLPACAPAGAPATRPCATRRRAWSGATRRCTTASGCCGTGWTGTPTSSRSTSCRTTAWCRSSTTPGRSSVSTTRSCSTPRSARSPATT